MAEGADRLLETGGALVRLWRWVEQEERERRDAQRATRARARQSYHDAAEGVGTTNRQQFLKTVGVVGAAAIAERAIGSVTDREVAASVDEATALARYVETTEVGPTTLEGIDFRVQMIGEVYRTTSFHDLFHEIPDCKREVAGLLAAKHTTAEDLHLSMLAAQLSGLMGDVLFNLGRRDAAWLHCLAGVRHARDAGHPETLSWLYGMQSVIRFYQGRDAEALRLAWAGERYARNGSASSVRLYAHLARVAARAGKPDEARRALRASEHAWNTLPAGTASNSMFSINDALRSFYAGTTLLWIGEPHAASEHLARAVRLYDSPVAEDRSPCNQTLAMLDDAAAHLELGEPEEAARLSAGAITSYAAQPRRAQPIARRARELRAKLAPHAALPAVKDFTEQLRQFEAPPAITAP